MFMYTKQGAPFDQQVVAEDRAAVVAGQVKVAVLRHVDERGRVRCRLENTLQLRM